MSSRFPRSSPSKFLAVAALFAALCGAQATESAPRPDAAQRWCNTHYHTLLTKLDAHDARVEANGGYVDPARRHRILSELYRYVDSIATEVKENGREFRARIKLVSDPQEGFLSKVLIARQAKRAIYGGTYIFKKDAIGYTLLQEVRDALRRGVDFYFVVDSQGSIDPFHSELKALMEAERGFTRDAAGNLTRRRAQVNVVVFNPFYSPRAVVSGWYRLARNFVYRAQPERQLPVPRRWRNRRMHDKIWAADLESHDDAVAVVGGRNLAEEYYGIPQKTPKTYVDMEVLVRNGDDRRQPVNLENTLGHHYRQLFYHLGNKPLEPLWGGAARPAYRRHIAKMESTRDEILAPATDVGRKLGEMERDGFLHEGLESAEIQVLHEVENIERRHAFVNPPKVWRYYQDLNKASLVDYLDRKLREAKRSIDIVSPYLTLTDDELRILKDWLAGDPKRRVRFITNSIATGDNMLAQAEIDTKLVPTLYRNPGREGINEQIEFLQYGKLDGTAYGGKEFYGKIHAKFMIFDGRVDPESVAVQVPAANAVATPATATLAPGMKEVSPEPAEPVVERIAHDAAGPEIAEPVQGEASVQSHNLDQRSRNLNSETGIAHRPVAGSDQPLRTVQQLSEVADRLAAHSYQWGSDDWKALRERRENRWKRREESLMNFLTRAFHLEGFI